MSNNIYSSSDDDIFQDYVEPTTTSESQDNFSTNEQTVDQIFPDIDSPFRDLLQNSSMKVNFGDAFYNAAHQWTLQGYREANAAAMMETLAEVTNGKFLYNHRLTTSKEVLNRKKTIIKFLSMMLESNTVETFVHISDKTSSIQFSETYFNMFFRSFYNIQLHTYYCELAVYKALSEMLELPIDPVVCDPHSESEYPILNSSDHINDLYIKYFQADELGEKIGKYTNELFQTEKA